MFVITFVCICYKTKVALQRHCWHPPCFLKPKMKKPLLILLCVLSLPFCMQASGETAREVLKQINFARSHPWQYADMLEARMGGEGAEDVRATEEAISFLRHTTPLAPLAFSKGMTMGALLQVEDQGASGASGHRGSDASSPWDRIAAFGRWAGSAGENISYGHADARSIVASLIIDAGVWTKGHRKNIFSPDFGVAGIACGTHIRYGTMCVIDFAGSFVRGERELASAHNSWGAKGSYTTGWHKL